jgi:phosphonate transport system substrate-binding protein
MLSTLTLLLLQACSGKPQDNHDRELGDFTIVISPLLDPETILNRFTLLEEPIKTLLEDRGYKVNSVNVVVSSTYAAAGEALSTGSISFGFLNNLSYAEYSSESIEPILLPLRGSYSVDSSNPNDFNTGQQILREPTVLTDAYYGLIHVGPSDYGRYLYEQFSLGHEISWEMLNQAKWCLHANVTSATGYVLPSIWLRETYNKGISNLDHVLSVHITSEFPLYLAQEECDIAGIYAGLRTDYEHRWQNDFKRLKPIWDEVKVIGVTASFKNDPFVVSWNHPAMTEELKMVLQDIFLILLETEAGKEAFMSLNIIDMIPTQRSDFDELVQKYQNFKVMP